MKRCSIIAALMLLVCGLTHADDVDASTFTPQQLEFFETKIRPVLVDNCYQCHSHEAKKPKGGFYLDSRAQILAGALAEPGDPDFSMMIEAVRYDDPANQMPPAGKLPDHVIEDLEKWVEMGLPWPEEAAPGDGETFDLEARRASHWAWQPLAEVDQLPQVQDQAQDAGAIDRFIGSRLTDAGLEPGPQADRATLIRRVTFDLTGLPPTPAEVHAFVNDPSPDAYEALVDRLLASPRFGEKWARHWLDLVRYSESYGHEFDYSIPHAWKYRDYVIRALNDDVPYDRFVQEHIAGDLISARVHPDTKVNEAVKATGWWFMHEQTHAPTDVRLHEADRIDNQIDVLSKTFMGMTVSCARCHDHKFDAISEDDYYSLTGYLQSSRQQEAYLDPDGKIDDSLDAIRAIIAQGQSAYADLAPAAAEATVIEHSESEVFEDFNDETSTGWSTWSTTGWAWGDRPTRVGEWDATSGQGMPVLPGVAHSGLLGDQTIGTLRSPEFDYRQRHVWLLVKGKGRARLILDSYTMARYNGLLFEGLEANIDTKGQWQWVRLSAKRDFYHGTGNHRGYLEIVDDHHDAHLILDEVRFGDGKAPPPPTRHENAAAVPDEIHATFAEFTKQLKQAASQMPKPERALAITDGSPEDSYVHIRGSWRGKGEPMPRRQLTALGGESMARPTSGSGRDSLARSMTSPDNPLVARVQVNRLWHHLFGRGIVPTVDNFGLLGIEPSHPELLDYLAVTFVEDDQWSNKAMIKRMVMTSTYQRSSDKVNLTTETKDPDNVLLHRQNIRRLTAEGIRDSILFVAGSLNEKRFGPSVPVNLTAFMEGRGRPKSGPVDGDGRRSIYISVRRNFLSPMMLTFDMPIPFSTVGQRNQSNVPAQALTLMNDPFVHDQAEKWAKRLLEEEQQSQDDRVDAVFFNALGRAPSAVERDVALAFVIQEANRLGIAEDRIMADPRPWAALCHSIFNIKAFTYIR